jgi:PAS domain S-box-containing protein
LALLKNTEPIYARLREQRQITHLYFHQPDRRVFLRAHQPESFGDLIKRQSLRHSAKTGEAGQGLEMGPLGTFTLRVVIPWRQNGRLLGYLEMGQEVELLINTFFLQVGTELFFTINKKFLDKKQLVNSHSFQQKDMDWNLPADNVIVLASKRQMLPALRNALEYQQVQPAHGIRLDFNGRKYRGISQPLLDSARQPVGEFLVMRDVSAEMSDYYRTITFSIVLCLILGGGFFCFFTIILGKTETQLETTRLQLLTEMQKVSETNRHLKNESIERKTAETALNKVQKDLEVRVLERTEQLWLALEQTRQTREQLTSILASVADGMIVISSAGLLQLLNERAAQLFNCKASEAIGQPLKTLIQDPALLRRMEEALRQKRPGLRIEFSQMSADLKKPLFLQARTSVITGKQEETTGIIFLIQDISHEREMERMKSEFISTVVHELSTPLTAILGYTELLLSGQQFDPEDNREFLTIVHEKAQFLATLVGDMLDISRIESGRPLELHKSVFSAAELFERPIHHFHRFSANHQFIIDIKDPQLQFAADKEKIWQVMENLCSNAVKYSPKGGDISVCGRRFENGYQVTISDQGVGLTPEQTARVFEKFYRGNQSDTSIGGTGLGLTIVKSIIDAHDGQIWLDSELGQGTSVHFVLPTQG